MVDGRRDDGERRLAGIWDAGNWLVSASRSLGHSRYPVITGKKAGRTMRFSGWVDI